MILKMKRAALAVLACLFWLAIAVPAQADIGNYEFQLVQNELKVGEAEVAVRLLNKATGQNVPDAVIFARRIDMAPDGMAMMDSPLEPLPVTEPGIYRYKTNLTMGGRWQLSLAAKIQGEEGTLENRLILTAQP